MGQNKFEKFADSGYRLLEFGQKEALVLGYPETEPIHLLLGLLKDKEGSGSVLIRELGVDTEMLYQQVKEALVLEQRGPLAERTIGLSNRSKIVVRQVAKLCSTSLGPIAGSEHFLLALLYKENDLAMEMLAHNHSLPAIRTKRQGWATAYPTLFSRLLHADEFVRRQKNKKIS